MTDIDFEKFLEGAVYCDGKLDEIDEETKRQIRGFVEEHVEPTLKDIKVGSVSQ